MNAEKKRVFITVKTYPNISDKYAELVCTAGILEDGTWIRLYPVPFRLLKKEQQFVSCAILIFGSINPSTILISIFPFKSCSNEQ